MAATVVSAPVAAELHSARTAEIRCTLLSRPSHRLLRGRIATVVGAGGLPVAGQGAVEELEPLLAGSAPDVIVLGCDIARADAVVDLRRARRAAPAGRIVVVSPLAHHVGARRALNAGADGFVADGQLEAALVATVRAVHAGQVCAPRDLRRLVVKPSFSHREKEILALVATGATNFEIAARLFLTESTVKSHLASAFEKLGVRSRKDAAALLLDPDEGLQPIALPPLAPPARLTMNTGGSR